MAALQELIAKIENPELRAQIQEAADKALKRKQFGLVFEEHLPECTPLHDVPVRKGKRVSLKTGKVSETYKVLEIQGDKAICLPKDSNEAVEFSIDDLVVTAEFGEPIYPCLKPLGEVCNAPDSELWHTLIEADNYHALQLLEYLYGGKVDCIYIDPPYNTGAKDWKYNNDYVDGTDEYRHSKWLSFIKKRLEIAKRLLNPESSVLFITIDDKEYLHLGCLLEDMFPEARIQMISDVINPKGTMQRKKFPRTDEYIFCVWLGEAEPTELTLSKDWLIGDADNTNRNRYRWVTFIRTAPNVSRSKTPSMFYPIFVNKEGTKIIRVGESLGKEVDYQTIKPQEGECVLFPINSQGREVIWHLTQTSLMEAYSKGFVKLSGITKNGVSISYLPSGMQKKISDGDIPILGYDENGAVIFDASDYAPQFMPGTQWRIKTHDATEHGTKLLQKLIGNRFSYPKSLYSTKDCINFFLCNKPNALIVDFFAGSGTTLHAINLLNAEDGGNRRCIMVTNNEVSGDEAKTLTAKGLKPGDKEWNNLGIARYVTWPRTVCSIEGHDVNGNPLKGNYIGSDIPMADGFKANAAFFKLGFLDKTKVSLGMQFKELLSTLWMKAGAIGRCPVVDATVPDMLILPENKMAILNDENQFGVFAEKLAEHPEIDVVYLVTDYEGSFVAMTRELPGKTTYQLYRDYLDNFRINAGRNSR
ncbi:MAG: site-specific DNA-methyltransferase [Clostridia bacterium]|nr:site-specific DNA-methyltransferase [Clostridia bacterium]